MYLFHTVWNKQQIIKRVLKEKQAAVERIPGTAQKYRAIFVAYKCFFFFDYLQPNFVFVFCVSFIDDLFSVIDYICILI